MSTRTSKDGIRCGGCGHVHSAASWRALPTLQTLTPADVNAYVVAWPEGCAVDVRACGACGRRIARLR
jgi:hypothetical protein